MNEWWQWLGLGVLYLAVVFLAMGLAVTQEWGDAAEEQDR